MKNQYVQVKWLLLLLLIPAVQGALNQPEHVEVTLPYDASLGAAPTIYSGQAEATQQLDGPFALLESNTRITGLDKVCWGALPTQCLTNATATISGSVGFQSDAPVQMSWRAAHLLGFYINESTAWESNQDYELGPSLYGFMLNGEATVQFPSRPDNGMLPLDDQTIIVLSSSQGNYTHQGEGDPLGFHGGPRVISTMDGMVLPASHGVIMSPAAPADADEALNAERINQVLGTLGAAVDTSQLTQLEGTLSGILNGAILAPDNLTLIRFESLTLSDAEGDLVWSGQAHLVITNGSVENASSLVGVKYVSMPWWAWALWAVAIVLFIVRAFVVKPEKTNERWDAYNWIGIVAGVAAFIATFVLWDFEMRQVWGSSLLSKPNGAVGLAITALLQLATYSLVMFAVAAPLRIIFRNGFLLGKQGTFMNLAAPIATMVGFLLGAHLLSAYLDFFLSQVMDQFANQ